MATYSSEQIERILLRTAETQECLETRSIELQRVEAALREMTSRLSTAETTSALAVKDASDAKAELGATRQAQRAAEQAAAQMQEKLRAMEERMRASLLREVQALQALEFTLHTTVLKSSSSRAAGEG